MTEAISRVQQRRVGGIEIRLLLHYVSELGRTSGLGLRHYDELRRHFATWTQEEQEKRHARAPELDLYVSIEGFLAGYARSSLLLFPGRQRPFTQQRGRALREFLGIPDDDPIGNRRLRNDWMHYDERLDDLIESTDRGRWSFLVLPGGADAPPGARAEFIRLVDPLKEIVSFLGRNYSLRELAEYLQKVRDRIEPAILSITTREDA